MSVKAIIMAGGKGARLRPMTCQLPKPLVPILERPVMEYTLLLLRRHGIRDVNITLCYRGAQIRRQFGTGNRYGMKLRYVQEEAPRGTAGSILPLQKHMQDTFIVLSGDGLTDCDLRDALRFHKAQKALATLVLKKTSVPLPYGVVMTDEQHRITRFIEKPSWQQVFSDLVNTGIYLFEPEVFDYIPREGTPDFARDVFPRLLQEGKLLCGYEMQGYWCDIGNQQAYLDAQLDLLQGKADLPHPQGIAPTAVVHPTAKVRGSCYIGPHATVGPGAEITDTVLYAYSRVQNRAVIQKSCLWQHALAGEDAFLNHAMLCENAAARRETVLSSNSALGQYAEAAEGSMLCSSVTLYPHLHTVPHAHVRCSLLENTEPYALHCGALLLTKPEDACLFAAAAAAKLHPTNLLLSAEDATHPLFELLNGALRAQGIHLHTLSLPALPMAQTLVSLYDCDCALHLSAQHLFLLDKDGNCYSDKQWQPVLQAMQQQNFPPSFSASGQCTVIPDGERQYLRRILPPDTHPASLNTRFHVFRSNKPLLKLCGKALVNAGARYVSMNTLQELSLGNDEIGFILHEDGRRVLPITQDMTPTPEQATLLSLLCCRIYQGKLYHTHPPLPRHAELWGTLSPRDASPGCMRQMLLLRDGVAMCAHLAPLLDAQSLQHWLDQLPASHVREQSIPCPDREKGRILRTLSQTALSHQLEEGLHIHHSRGDAAIVPDAREALIRIRSESRDSEFARELCDLYSRKVKALLQSSP